MKSTSIMPDTGTPIATPPAATRYRLWAGAVIVVVLLVGGFLLYRHHHNQQTANAKAKAVTQPYAFSYKNSSGYKVPGQKAGSGLSFNVPDGFKPPPGPKPAGVQEQAQFSQTVSQTKSNNTVTATIGNLAAASVYSASAPDPNYLALLASNLAKPNGPNYANSVKAIEDFVNSGLPVNYSASFSAAQVFKTGNITANAWHLDFTASAKQGKTLVPEPPLQGEAILAIGKAGYYYYFADAVNYNWSANQTFWQQMLGSLKIDQ